MNRADEKKLHADPRYRQIMAAHAALRVRLDEIEALRQEAIAAFEAAAPEGFKHLHNNGAYGPSSEHLFDMLRPRGDRVRLGAGIWHRESEAEIENVTAARITLVGHRYEFSRGGDQRGGGHSDRRHISPEDVERINRGELLGWRQKPWGTP